VFIVPAITTAHGAANAARGLADMREVRQPGPVAAAREVAVPALALPLDAWLPEGEPLLAALHRLVAAAGGESACFAMEGGALGPFGYVMPAPSPDAAHAAFYSAPFRPAGVATLEAGAVTVGWRDGLPFFHAHAIWQEAGGTRRGGHLLPEETVIAAPIRVRGAAIRGARFEAVQDAETGFRLFEPVPTDPPEASDALALRLRPNQDLTRALEAQAVAAGLGRARVLGGVGSVIGARFAGQPPVEPFATEMFLQGDALGAPLRAGLVDMTGALATGVLVPDDNPILMTLEVLLARG
jgi:predicted DNA-binding protein with PD1-like motif